MTRPVEFYTLAEAPEDVYGLIRYSGDPDEFTACAHAWLTQQRPRFFDYPMAVAPPEPSWWRWTPDAGGEFEKILTAATGPGPGAWLGAMIRTVQIGCSECLLVGGRHTAGCLNEGVTGLVTLQFAGQPKGPLSPEWVHAIRSRPSGTPGRTLCDIARYGPDSPGGWTVGGGPPSPTGRYIGCYLCGKRARREFPGLAIVGTRLVAEAFARDCRIPLSPHQAAEREARGLGELARQEGFAQGSG